jgi:hypothetical protein
LGSKVEVKLAAFQYPRTCVGMVPLGVAMATVRSETNAVSKAIPH